MHVAVIGAGIAGVSTACELVARGHEVCVFERHASVAAQASFAPSGLLGPGLFTSPTDPVLWHPGASLWALAGRLQPGVSPAAWRWLRRLHARLSGPQRVRDVDALRALAGLGREDWPAMAAEAPIEKTTGHLMVWSSPPDRAHLEALAAELARGGLDAGWIGPDACATAEPHLHVQALRHNGLYWPRDLTANCRQVAQRLRELAEAGGAEFRFGADVVGVSPGPRPSVSWRALPASSLHPTGPQPPTQPQEEAFSAVILCSGTTLPRGAPPLAQAMALHGTTLTAPLRSPDAGPRACVSDVSTGITLSRTGLRVRVGGLWRLGDAAGPPDAASPLPLYQALDQWFPAAVHRAQAQAWRAGVLALPDGLPVVGPTSAPGLWVNLAHGIHGWALSAGSARLLCDLLDGRASGLDPAPYAPGRPC